MAARKEPAVISLHLLTSSLEAAQAEHARATNPGSTAALPPISLPTAEALALSFRGLARIQNLDCLRCLRKLQLDNNGITRIEGLGSVAGSLEWLDLSFNALTSCEGLGALPRLTDLSLFHNSITQVAGLEGCSALQCLSLGENALEDLLGSVLYVRKRAPTLEVLTLEGNPLCKLGEGGREVYRPFFLAFCPRLKYLDYQLITEAERSAAREGGVPAEKLAEVEDADAAEAKAAAKAREKASQLADYVAANLEVIETMYSDLFGEGDAEWEKLRHMPAMPHALLALRESLEPLAATLRASGMEKNARIQEEIQQYQEALNELVGSAAGEAAARVHAWEAALKAARNDHKAAVEGALSMGGSSRGSSRGGVMGGGGGGGGGSAASAAERSALAPRTAAALEALGSSAAVMSRELLKGELAVHEAVEVRAVVLRASGGGCGSAPPPSRAALPAISPLPPLPSLLLPPPHPALPSLSRRPCWTCLTPPWATCACPSWRCRRPFFAAQRARSSSSLSCAPRRAPPCTRRRPPSACPASWTRRCGRWQRTWRR